MGRWLTSLALLAGCSSGGGSSAPPAVNPAQAAPYAADVRWTQPTEREDDTPLAPQDLTRACVYYGRAPAREHSQCEDTGGTKMTVPLPAGGAWWFTVTVFAGASESAEGPWLEATF